jgi:hypothetical protein
MALGLGLALAIAFILTVLYAIQRSMEGAAFRKAQKLAAEGQPELALRAVLGAMASWGFNTAHDVRSTRVAALDRLDAMARLAVEQAHALGRSIAAQDLATTIQHLRHLLGTKEHYSWGSDQSLKSEYKVHLAPLMAQLRACREQLRAACTQALDGGGQAIPAGVSSAAAFAATALAPAPVVQTNDVLVRGPDGREYAGVVTSRRPGQVQVAFANGSSTWMPEGNVRPARPG